MNYNEAIEYIHTLGNFSLVASLERITKVLEKLGNPQNSFKSIHVAGTNGKGSTCTYIASILREGGYKVGLFVSPYITDFCERISINGQNIPKNRLAELTQKVKSFDIPLTEFEFITAVGFLYFSQSACDVAVIETGLGGRLDATNTLKNPTACVITKIGLDHTAILGDTIEKITTEKCGIIKNGRVVTTPNQESSALDVIKKHADTVIAPDLKELAIKKCDILGNTFIYKGQEYTSGLIGEFQIYNALTAIEAVAESGIPVSVKVIIKGIETAFIPARMELVSKQPPIIIDGAHNPDGAAALSNFLKGYDGEITVIVGVMRDKNYNEVLKTLLPLCKNVICVKATDSPRALPEKELADTAKAYCGNVFVAKNHDDALAIAKQKAKDGAIFIFGSLYLASDMRRLIKDK